MPVPHAASPFLKMLDHASDPQQYPLFLHVSPQNLTSNESFQPIWEDDANRRGGKWIVRIPKGLAPYYWEQVVLAIIGEQFDVGNEICGAVMSIRFNEDIIAIWNRHASNVDARSKIRDMLYRILRLPHMVQLDYKPHDASLKETSSATAPGGGFHKHNYGGYNPGGGSFQHSRYNPHHGSNIHHGGSHYHSHHGGGGGGRGHGHMDTRARDMRRYGGMRRGNSDPGRGGSFDEAPAIAGPGGYGNHGSRGPPNTGGMGGSAGSGGSGGAGPAGNGNSGSGGGGGGGGGGGWFGNSGHADGNGRFNRGGKGSYQQRGGSYNQRGGSNRYRKYDGTGGGDMNQPGGSYNRRNYSAQQHSRAPEGRWR